MDKYNGIKRADVTVRRNSYKAKCRAKRYRSGGPKILWRYVVAALIVAVVSLCATFTDWGVAELFKQDYIEQYEKD